MKILAIDPSASHLAYTIIEQKTLAKATILATGIIWTKPDWPKGKKLSYVYKCITDLIKTSGVEEVYSEAFFTNPKLRSGSLVLPAVNGIIEMICYEQGVLFDLISPASWRNTLGIKSVKTKGKRDFKTPTKEQVERILKIKLPITVLSNITSNERGFPHDISDSMAIGIAVIVNKGINSFDINEDAWYNRYISMFNLIAGVI